MKQDEFEAKLTGLIAAEQTRARNNPQRMAALYETLCRCAGFTIAVATKGNPEAIDKLAAASEGYIHSEAVAQSRLARFLEGGAR